MLLEDVEELIRRAGDATDPELERLRRKVRTAIATLSQASDDRLDGLQRRARQAVDAGNTYVHERAWQAVGIAGLLGIAVGFLFARR